MKALRPEEEWAREIVSRTLSLPVEQHDDGSRDGMHDLWIRDSQKPSAAVEVTTAGDPEAIKLSKLVHSGEPVVADALTRRWLVYLDPIADGGKRRFDRLPSFLAELEKAGERRVDVEPEDLVGSWETRAHDLGIAHASQIGTASPGTIHVRVDMLLERSAGFVGDSGDPIAAWVSIFLRDECPDVLLKLARSRAPERHAFVFVPPIGFSTAPFAVSELLARQDLPLPLAEPQLPPQVTHVWVVRMWNEGAGCYWNPDTGWSSVRTQPAPSEAQAGLS